MSKYFEILERLEHGRGEAPAGRLAERPSGGRAAPTPFGTPGPLARTRVAELPEEAPTLVPLPREHAVEAPAPEPAPAATRPLPFTDPSRRRAGQVARLQGIETIFNNLEALTLGRRPMTLVFAGATAANSVAILANRLTQHARERGFGVVLAELSRVGSESIVRQAAVSGRDDARAVDPLVIDLHGAPNQTALGEWRERVSPGAEITFVVGPALDESVDAALLASQCDGLVLVAVQDETPRDALAAAAERARLTTAPTLGVVVHATGQRMPAWLRRIVE